MMRVIYYDVGVGFLADAHHYHTIDELRRSGHEVIYVNPMRSLGREVSLDECCEVVLNAVRKHHNEKGVDLFFSLVWDEHITGDVVREIRAMGIPTVNWSLDDISHPFRVKRISSSFDLCWSSARESESILRGYGARNLLIMPFAANPHMFKPTNESPRRVVSFIGSAYGARARGVTALAQAHVPVEVYGTSPMSLYGTKRMSNPIMRATTSLSDGWQRLISSVAIPAGRQCIYAALKRSVIELVTNPPEKNPTQGSIEYLDGPDFVEMAKLLSSSALTFGSIELASTYVMKHPLLFIRWREFEAPMAGAVHIVNRFPELQEYFEEDKEMLFYGSVEELVDKARFYLAPERDAQRSAISKRAATRARAEHTWMHRFRRIGDALGLAF